MTYTQIALGLLLLLLLAWTYQSDMTEVVQQDDLDAALKRQLD